MDNKVIFRKRIKAEASFQMGGSWLSSLLIMIINGVMAGFILSLLPLRAPEVNEILEAGENVLEAFLLFLPREITTRTVASFVVTGALFMLVMFPFGIGIKRFFLKVAHGEKGKVSDVFSVYGDLRLIFSSVFLWVMLFLLSCFWAIVFSIIPYVILALGFYLSSAAIVSFSWLLFVAAGIFTVFWVSRYDFAGYILASGKCRNAFSSLRACFRLIKGRTGELLRLRASYIVWDIVCGMGMSFPLTFIYNSLYSTVYAKYLMYFESVKE